MSITIKRLDSSHHIILFKVTGNWQWDEMDAVRKDLYVILDSHPYPVYVVYDFTEAGRLPSNSFARLRAMNRQQHPAAGHTSLVGVRSIYRTMLDAFLKIYGRFVNPFGVYFFNTVDEAVAFIHQTHNTTPQ